MKAVAVAVFSFCVVHAHAVVVAGGDGTQNTTAPAGDQGWSNVGRITSANNAPSSVTYLNNNWFITANHVKVLDNPTGVLLGLDSYTIDAGSWTRLTNSVGTDADLMMFRVNESVGAPGIGISAATPGIGAGLTMIGNGLNRYPSLLTLSLTGTDETFYHLKSGIANTSKRWGTNTSEGYHGVLNQGYGSTETFWTDFDYVANEAQGATYDSGGGVFVNNAGSWELAGIMLGVGNLYSIGGTNAVMLTGGNKTYDGSETYIADLSVYSDQINSTMAIPEPSVAILGLACSVVAFFIRRVFMI